VLLFIKGSIRLDSPLAIVSVLLVVTVWWWRRPSSRWPWRVLAAFAVTLYLAATPIGADLLVAGLGHGLRSIATRDEARGADAVVVLSGGVETMRADGVVLSQLGPGALLRVLEAARVYKLIGARYVVVSGGIGDPKAELRPEGDQMVVELVAAGVPADRILLDPDARNTHDHPRTVRPLVEVHQIRRFVLVTSPMHMRRALAVFRAAGFDPVPSVSLLRSDHLDPPPFFLPNDDSMELSDSAIYDYAALTLYWWRGWLK
jgi:uncharacterized SAM-binding protein YcdF (DUF218 family)